MQNRVLTESENTTRYETGQRSEMMSVFNPYFSYPNRWAKLLRGLKVRILIEN